ncbi:MAG: Holliday junction branch migration DNA helicase RuvB [Candidatus Berkelbacteria bacterium]|nr:Holliday junction branch migration DNA helicase RuvB [Candidatus Berkelbacteria bacterium]
MTNKEQNIVNTTVVEEDIELDNSLRPKKLSDYVGQNAIKENLDIFISAAKKRNEPVEHILLYGPPGLGKTTLAHIIANEMGANIRVTSGTAIERAGDLASILTSLQDGDILFIDEIHRLNRNIEEVLYPAMEDYAIDMILGKGPSAKTLRLDVPKFTLIGATTKIGALSSPLRDRFGNIFRLEFYETNELEDIITRSAKILNIKHQKDGLSEIAKRARKTPRVANRILKRVRDFAEVRHQGEINEEIANLALEMLDIDSLGLDKTDRMILETIIDKFSGGPVGLDALAAATSEDRDTIEDVIEPYLMRLGFIDRTPRGRVATPGAYEHLNKTKVSDGKQKLL